MISVQKKQKINRYLKSGIYALISVAFFYAGTVFAQGGGGGSQDATHISHVASNVTLAFGNIAKLTTAGLYVVGMIFALISLLKFKAHKDNPQSTQLSQPLTYLFLAAAMLFTPTLFGVGGKTLFGTGAKQGNVTGFEAISS